MCLNPKWIYKKGKYKENNYRGQKDDIYELGTYSKCGFCEQCISEKCNNWVIRNHYESMNHEKKCFITLTYKENPYIIVKKDMQDFIKRLRRYFEYRNMEKIRYFANMEYGTLNNRPHGHIIIYGWEDENAKYIGINKKKNIIYQSEIIQKIWGLGRTSYQKFNDHEIPYITLYETPKETFARAYKLNAAKIKKLNSLIMNNYLMDEKQKENVRMRLFYAKKELEDQKKEYTLIKECNTWSTALGWEKFYENYATQKDYTFEEYIEDKKFVTPSPWVKKLANMGDIQAAIEMYRREELIKESATEEDEKNKNINIMEQRRKKEIFEWADKKDKEIYL